MKLNLGCGFNKLDGYINVDNSAVCKPDQVFDIESTPWPWQDSSIDEIRLDHVLEHIGVDPKTYISVWKEIWRVSKPNAQIFIRVPHWRHENFAHDPTHVRPITPVGIAMFDQLRNREDEKRGGQETKLGLMYAIDVAIERVEYVFVPEIQQALEKKFISQEKASSLMEHENNVCQEIKIGVRVMKPCRG
ncbi:MAG: hypothetical protein V4519_02320 [Patescibacteria group bacterium]